MILDNFAVLRLYQKKKICKYETLHSLRLKGRTMFSMLLTQKVSEVQRLNAQIHARGVRITMAMQSKKTVDESCVLCYEKEAYC